MMAIRRKHRITSSELICLLGGDYGINDVVIQDFIDAEGKQQVSTLYWLGTEWKNSKAIMRTKVGLILTVSLPFSYFCQSYLMLSSCSMDLGQLVHLSRNKKQVFNCFGQYFCLHFEAFSLGMSPVYMAFLRFMGEDSEAKNFSYSLEVGGNHRKLMWQGIPRSIRDGYRKVRDSYDGLVIHRNIALFFSGGNRQELKLRVTGRIWRNIE
ncbi:hypothetical protein Taro_008054 [Colocasia esculenta]|uniref:Seven-in-absentia protein TRAF-like domain-containing protein n=1 Tax=Colocasia esculenta TaxID=4460 RepID=A0A843U294_COLES|nr:hypothetical protein [Colocasia esculenta]